MRRIPRAARAAAVARRPCVARAAMVYFTASLSTKHALAPDQETSPSSRHATMSPLPRGEGVMRPPSDDRRSSFDPTLDIFHRSGSNTVGPIEEVGIVGRPAGDEEEVLLRAFQGRNGR